MSDKEKSEYKTRLVYLNVRFKMPRRYPLYRRWPPVIIFLRLKKSIKQSAIRQPWMNFLRKSCLNYGWLNYKMN